MSTRIPDQFINGSEPLDKNQELLALGLVGLAFALARNTLDSKVFKKTLEIKRGFIGVARKREDNRMLIELTMFYLFYISRWMSGNYDGDSKEVLDRVFFHISASLGDNDPEFFEYIEVRHAAYTKAINDETGAGSVYWVGKEATQNVLGKKDVDPRIFIKSTMLFANYMKMVCDSVKQFVTQKEYLKENH